jgi:hypothetical protein
MTGHLFTVICDFAGGTYVSQVRTADERQALSAWAEGLRKDRPTGDEADDIATETSEDADALVPLDRLTGVWCWTGTVRGFRTCEHRPIWLMAARAP